MKHLVLDSESVGILANAKPNPVTTARERWMNSMLAAGCQIYLPEIIDYELRRELVRAKKTGSLTRLDALPTRIPYLPLTTDTLRLAADLWAWSRNSGLSTGDPKRLDIDVILAAQALTLGAALQIPPADLVIVTSNVAHLSRFVAADLWSRIAP